MERAEHLARLREDGERLAEAAAAAGLDADVPTCPGWQVRDLLRHVGDVHRWARAHVAEGRLRRIGKDELPAVAGPLPADEVLLDWYRLGHARLVETLASADPDLVCWTFLPAPSPLAFWTRRQAHETAIHRADAEAALGTSPTFPAPFAADGVEELLLGFFGRPAGDGGDGPPPTSLHLRAEDAGLDWLVRVGPAGTETTREAAPADCSVTGPASDLYLLLWNRRTVDGLAMSGDRAVLEDWRTHATITWGGSRD
jgi:uncharacterized protein (TIGR03083 family)